MNFKILKKVVLGFLLSVVAMTAYAAPSLIMSEVTGSAGDTVTVPITFTNDDSVVGMDFKLKYNPELLTLNSVDRTAIGGSISNHSNDVNKGVITFLFANFPLKELSSGEILVKFNINDSATPDATASLALRDITFSNKAAGNIIAGKIVDGNVVIKVANANETTQNISTPSAGIFSPWFFLFLMPILFLGKKRKS